MPTYHYRCTSCGATEDIVHRMEDQAQHRCQHCGGRMLRIIQPSALRFTGTGFYTTDYKAKK